jgi:hypothetical protein
MFLQVLAGALVASGVFYVLTPRMPKYQLNGIHLYDLSISPLNLSFDCHLRAGIEIENENFFGAEIYSAFMDVYYNDWSGRLTPIGFVKEADGDTSLSSKWAFLYSDAPHNNSSNHRQKVQRVVHADTMNNSITSSGPFISILPRTITISEANALSIFLKNLTPRIYLNIIYDTIKSAGSLSMLVSGVAHVQSSFGLPLTLGVVCDNSLNVRWRPFHITSRNCEVKSISMGWKDLQSHAAKLRHFIIQTYTKKGRSGVFSQMNDHLKNVTTMLTSADKITEWHSF